MSMNVKSPSPPFIFCVKKCDPPPGSSKIYSDPPLCCVKLLCQIYADPLFLGRQKVNDPPLNSSGAPPPPPTFLKNKCSLSNHDNDLLNCIFDNQNQ